MFALSSLSQWEKDNHLLIWNVIQSELRNAEYDDIQPGFHMRNPLEYNCTKWISFDVLVKELIDHSELIF
jgi:hypothetical protein